MKLLKKFKKGFTLVELVVVIAVIAILAAVSVVSYIGVTNNAKKSNDLQVLSQVNNCLVLRETKDGEKPATMHEALNVLESDLGVNNVSKLLTASYSKYEFAYDISANRFVLLQGDKIAESAEGYEKETTAGQKYNFWKFSSDISVTDEYSHYCEAGYVADIVTCSGVDVGNNKIANITYSNSGDKKTVVIRTNSFGTSLTIDAKVGADAATSDDVYHYNDLGELTIEHMAVYSYHEAGNVAFAEVKEGRVVADEGGYIDTAIVTGDSDDAYAEEDGGIINIAYAVSEENKTKNNSEDSKKTLVYSSDKDTVEEVKEASNVYANEKKDQEALESNKDAVARIGLETYTTVANAFKAAVFGDTIYLLKDSNEALTLGYSIAKKITLDLNNHSLISTGDTLYLSYSSMTLTIKGGASSYLAGANAVRFYGSGQSVYFDKSFAGKVDGGLKLKNSSYCKIYVEGGAFKTENYFLNNSTYVYIPEGFIKDTKTVEFYTVISAITAQNAPFAVITIDNQISYYSKASNAVTAWESAEGNTLRINNDLNGEDLGNVNMNSDNNLKLDLNGKKWLRSGAETIKFYQGMLTIIDSVGGSEFYAEERGAQFLKLYNTGSAVINGGKISVTDEVGYSVETDSSATGTLCVNGGKLGKIYTSAAFNAINISGGDVYGITTAYNQSTLVTITGGTLYNQISCNQSSTGVFNISGGEFHCYIGNGGTFNISGGVFTEFDLAKNSNTNFNITGGTFDEDITTNARVTIPNGYHWDATTNTVVAD